jgi:hypothetical protein
MSTVLSFRPTFRSAELQSFALPVEVRAQNLALVGRTVSTGSIAVKEPGTYHVMAQLPAGQELYTEVTVLPDDTYKVIALTPDPEYASPTESLEVSYYFTRSLPLSMLKSQEVRDGEKSPGKLLFYSGNVLHGDLRQRSYNDLIRPRPASMPGSAEFYVPSGDLSIVQMIQPHAAPLNVMLPITPVRAAPFQSRGCRLVVARQLNGHYVIDVHLEDLADDALLRFSERGKIDHAAVQVSAPSLEDDRRTLNDNPETMLAAKVHDPLSAAVSAYVLLRTGQIDRLHNWTENL